MIHALFSSITALFDVPVDVSAFAGPETAAFVIIPVLPLLKNHLEKPLSIKSSQASTKCLHMKVCHHSIME